MCSACIHDVRYPYPCYCLDILRANAPTDSQMVGYPAHIELVRQGNMQGESDMLGLRLFGEEMGGDTRPATIEYPHDACREPMCAGEVYVGVLPRQRFRRIYTRGSHGWCTLHDRTLL